MITTHVLDTALGLPATQLHVQLERQTEAGAWLSMGDALTDGGGRVDDLSAGAGSLTAGVYRLRFDTGAYFERSARRCFFPLVEVCFRVDAPSEHHHVPLLLSPFGYSTYRGG